jgi:hypothetical protein
MRKPIMMVVPPAPIAPHRSFPCQPHPLPFDYLSSFFLVSLVSSVSPTPGWPTHVF